MTEIQAPYLPGDPDTLMDNLDELLNHIIEFKEGHVYAPSGGELAKLAGVSQPEMADRLKAAESLGLVRREEGQYRTISLPGEGYDLPVWGMSKKMIRNRVEYFVEEALK